MSDELRETFFLECQELLEALEAGLLDLSNGEADDVDETIAAVFRAVHSVKGGAGAFALDKLVRLAHKFETALDGAREKRLELTPDVMKLFLLSADALNDRVRAEQVGDTPDEAREAEIIGQLSAIIGEEADDSADAEEDPSSSGGFEPMALDFGGDLGIGAEDAPPPADELEQAPPVSPAEQSTGDNSDAGGFILLIEASAGFYQRGGDITLLLRALRVLGEIQTTCDADALPPIDLLNPLEPALRWRVHLKEDTDEAAVREIFEFVMDDCEVEIQPASKPGVPADSGTVQTDQPAETSSAATSPAPPKEPTAPSGAPSSSNEQTAAAAPSVQIPASASATQEAKTVPAPDTKAKAAAEPPKQTIRVDLDRIEQLINLVGELVINQAMLAQRMGETDLVQDQAIADGLDEFRLLTRDIQESVMAIRAQPVKPLFQRMARIVREAAHATGKDVRLVTSGEWTEVDKTIVERLSDPLTHMIRNAVDHGLENGDVRRNSGKPEQGVVTLSASHRSGRIIIDVADDGAGINREKVKAIAISKGLLPADAQPTEAEIDNLLFAPGFSTSAEVSDLSGRGVGMDVVKKAIQALGGRTSITSAPGRGSTFSISLPLTLAVLDGIVVSFADQTAVLPLSNVIETLRPSTADIKRIGSGAHVVLVRGAPLPVIDVGDQLGFRERLNELDDKVFIIVENHESDPHALVVDDIHDQRQVVIKGLEANYGETRGVSAATILGDGRIALILDVDVLVEDARSTPQAATLAMTG